MDSDGFKPKVLVLTSPERLDQILIALSGLHRALVFVPKGWNGTFDSVRSLISEVKVIECDWLKGEIIIASG